MKLSRSIVGGRSQQLQAGRDDGAAKAPPSPAAKRRRHTFAAAVAVALLCAAAAVLWWVTASAGVAFSSNTNGADRSLTAVSSANVLDPRQTRQTTVTDGSVAVPPPTAVVTTAPPQTTVAKRRRATPPPTAMLPIIPMLRTSPPCANGPSSAVDYAPALVEGPAADPAAYEDVVARAEKLIARSVDERVKLPPEQRERLRQRGMESRRKYRDTLDILPFPATSFDAPTPERLDTWWRNYSGNSSSDNADNRGAASTASRRVCYYVMTGKHSHRDRVAGLHVLLGRYGTARNVKWFSDEPEATIRPVVLRNSFEDHVCREKLAGDSQLKGCRYQRGFYRVVDAMLLVASAAIDDDSRLPKHIAAMLASSKNISNGPVDETTARQLREDFRRCDWFVRLSDDTVLIQEHFESVLSSMRLQETDGSGVKVNGPTTFSNCTSAERQQEADRSHSSRAVRPSEDAVVVGKVERRSSYQFFSGGHPIAFSRAAMVRFGLGEGSSSRSSTPGGGGAGAGTGVRCEGTVIDTAPAKLQKFWWWADDVLISHCLLFESAYPPPPAPSALAVESSKGSNANNAQPGGGLAHSSLPANLVYHVFDLPGAISVARFNAAPLPRALWHAVVPLPLSPATSEAAAATAPNATNDVLSATATKSRTSLATSPPVDPQLPVSYHTYPYVAPRQMFSLWNYLHPAPKDNYLS